MLTLPLLSVTVKVTVVRTYVGAIEVRLLNVIEAIRKRRKIRCHLGSRDGGRTAGVELNGQVLADRGGVTLSSTVIVAVQ